MRLILKGFLSLSLILVLAQPCFAQDSEEPKKSFTDNLKTIGKYMFPRAPANFTQPYKNDAKTSQNVQWNEEDWHPDDWAEAKGGVQQVLDGFEQARLVVDLHDDDVPVLEVGLPFMRISPPDQRRVIEFMDYAYKITDSQPGIFYIVLEDHFDELLGIYSKKGLQFQ